MKVVTYIVNSEQMGLREVGSLFDENLKGSNLAYYTGGCTGEIERREVKIRD